MLLFEGTKTETVLLFKETCLKYQRMTQLNKTDNCCMLRKAFCVVIYNFYQPEFE